MRGVGVWFGWRVWGLSGLVGWLEGLDRSAYKLYFCTLFLIGCFVLERISSEF